MKTTMTQWLTAVLLFFGSTVCQQTHAALSDYSKERPVIILCDWENPPFDFCNSSGQPKGYYIDILETILDEMDIPYQFVMKERTQAMDMFKQHQADLIFDPTGMFQDDPYKVSVTIFSYSKVKVAYRKGTPPFHAAVQLAEDCNIVVKSYDEATIEAVTAIHPNREIATRSPRSAMVGLIDGSFDYFVWTEDALRWKLRELRLTDKINISAATLCTFMTHLVGYDAELIEAIDDLYARMELNGTQKQLHSHWLEMLQDDTSPIALYITIIALLLLIVLYVLVRIAYRRVQEIKKRDIEVSNMMQQVLETGDYHITRYDIKANNVTSNYGLSLPGQGITYEQLLQHIHPDDRQMFNEEIENLKHGRKKEWEIECQWNKGTIETPHWIHIKITAVAEHDHMGQTHYIIGTVKNIHAEVEQIRSDEELVSKYIKMFDSLSVGMSFYDKNGHLIDLNENMKKLCGFNQGGERFFHETRLFDVPLFKQDFDPNSPDSFYVCQHMYYPAMGLDRYIEYKIKPIFDETGERQYYTITVRDVTDERQLYLDLDKRNKELEKTHQTINEYEHHLQHLLKSSKMFTFRSVPEKQIINFSYSLGKVSFTITFDEYIDMVYENERDMIRKALANYRTTTDPIYNIRHFRHTHFSDEPEWYAISMMPILDENGLATSHFGVLRNISELMDIQEQLRIETVRADFSGKQKSAFLANMTHEIRTPLNAIVGFSDLLNVVDEPEERKEFIRIILNNCDMLLRLINDILEASDIGHDQLTVEEKDVDFSLVFDDICQTLEQRVQEPGVAFIKENPYPHFYTTLDKNRIQQVCTNFVTNAVKYTHEGHIKLGYRYEREGLYIFCEDTGAGIPKDKQASVFERFVKLNTSVQGTGLGLNICQKIAKLCNGEIGVISEGEGKGSTFWLWIPCERREAPEANLAETKSV